MFAVAGDPLAQATAREASLGSDMGDRAMLTASHQTQTTFRSQRSITMGHRAGPSDRRRLSWSTSIIAAGDLPISHDLRPGDTNLMNRNN